MTTTPNDGGPAFARPETYLDRGHDGMSLRDYIAIHASEDDIHDYLPRTVGDCNDWAAKHGLLTRAECDSDAVRASCGVDDGVIRSWARYQFADRMLAERAKQQEPQP